MRLYIGTMDAILVEYAPDGRVRFENEDWMVPTVQESRAILHAAQMQIDELGELIQLLETR